MISKVIIENFQSHKKAELEFVPGTNVIIGASDSGKSAIFRAINWVITNRPLGDSFRSEWGGDTKVTIYTAEGDSIQRIRSASKNEYIVNGVVLRAFGMEVPEEVIQILGMDSSNIQYQMEPRFLLSFTPGEAARMLNKAASIDDIDVAISGLKKALNTINTELKTDKKQLASNQDKMKEYSQLLKIEELLNGAEEKEKELQKGKTILSELKAQTIRGNTIRNKLAKTNHIPSLFERTGLLHTSYTAFVIEQKAAQYNSRLLKRAFEIAEKLKRTEKTEEILSVLQKTEEKTNRAKEERKQLKAMNQLVLRARNLEYKINTAEKNIKSIHQEYEKLSPKECPLCGAVMKGGI